MKILTALFILVLSAFGADAQQNIEITIDGNMGLSQLQTIKMQLLEQNHLCNIRKMKFGKDGKLTELSIRVISPNGKTGEATKTFSSATDRIRIVSNQSADPSLCVGDC